MKIAGLITWALTAVFGGYLLLTWLANGGLRHRGDERESKFRPLLIFGHAGLAATGLVVWITYLLVASPGLAWVCVAILVIVASLGATMFGMWLRAKGPRGRHALERRHAAEDRFPSPAVLTHGALALTTAVLVVVTALHTNSS